MNATSQAWSSQHASTHVCMSRTMPNLEKFPALIPPLSVTYCLRSTWVQVGSLTVSSTWAFWPFWSIRNIWKTGRENVCYIQAFLPVSFLYFQTSILRLICCKWALLCCAVLCGAVMWCDVMWCDVMWCDVRGCDVMWCDVRCCKVLCCAIRCKVLCCAVLCCAVLCCAVRCCKVLQGAVLEGAV